MATLPDDVLLVIISHTQIDTFLTLRMLNRNTHDLINTHIRGLSEAVAICTFPRQTHILATSHELQTANAAACIGWLKGLRYHQLAAISLECRDEDSISAEDPLGDLLRDRLAEAWRVLQRFSAISREVRSLPLGDLPAREPPLTEEISGQLTDPYEVEICSRRMNHLDTLPLETIKAYKALHVDLIYAVFNKQLPSLPEMREKSCDVMTVLNDPIALPWMFSQFAELGAEYFWQRWWGCSDTSNQSPDQIGHDLTEMWLYQEMPSCKSEPHPSPQYRSHRPSVHHISPLPTEAVEQQWSVFLRSPPKRTSKAHGILCIYGQVEKIISRSLKVTQREFIRANALDETRGAEAYEDMTQGFTDFIECQAIEREILTKEDVEVPPMHLTGTVVESKLDWKAFGRVVERYTRVEIKQRYTTDETVRLLTGQMSLDAKEPRESDWLPEYRRLFSQWRELHYPLA